VPGREQETDPDPPDGGAAAGRRVRSTAVLGRAALALLLMLAAGCASARARSLPDPPPGTDPPATVSALTAIGDSVPAGSACGCTPYPQLTGDELSRAEDRHVTAWNDAVPGARSSDVVDQLEHDSSVIDHVKRSDAFLVEVGANDIEYSSSCGTTLSCYQPKVPAVTEHVLAIVARLRQLTAGRHISIVLVDYWNVWLGGRYARAQGPAYVRTADALTAEVDDSIQSIARTTGSRYIDLRTAFRGPDHTDDETDLLAPDGDHPNAAGQERIADAVEQALAT
jgi:lysophospholipase L1-like esterase